MDIYFSIINEKNVYIDFHGNYIRYFIEKDPAWIKAYSKYFCKKNVQISVYEPDRIIFCWNLKIIMRYLTACLKMLQTIFKAIYHAESRF